MRTPSSVRIGVLGAARIAPMALIRPAHTVEGVEVRAVAARDPKRAEAFRRKHKLERAHESYEALINDRNIEAIYNPLPNGLHAEWTIRALEAGKHVLCEKPFANNRTEAEQMAEVQKRTGRMLMEAFHYRYHPAFRRAREIVASGRLGRVDSVEAYFHVPITDPADIRSAALHAPIAASLALVALAKEQHRRPSLFQGQGRHPKRPSAISTTLAPRCPQQGWQGRGSWQGLPLQSRLPRSCRRPGIYGRPTDLF
mgnify:CR=1 FL=1